MESGSLCGARVGDGRLRSTRNSGWNMRGETAVAGAPKTGSTAIGPGQRRRNWNDRDSIAEWRAHLCRGLGEREGTVACPTRNAECAVINLAAGTKVFLACRPVDLRYGFDGLAAKVQQIIWLPIRSAVICLFFVESERIILRFCIRTAAACACSPVPGFTLNPFPFGRIILARWRVGAQQPGRRGGSIGYIV